MSGFESQILCQPGAALNEDAAFAGPDWLIVLDGSSGLNGRNLTPGPSDAAWFVENLGRCFAEEIARTPEASLEALLKRAVLTTRERYQSATQGAEIARIDQPAASVIAARWANGRLDYVLMGDARMVVQLPAGIRVFQDQRVAHFDQIALAQLRLALRGKKSFAAAMAEIQPILLKNRTMKNIPGGYGVLDLSEDCLAMAQTGSLPLDETGIVMAFSDGFAALVDVFGVAPNYPALVDLVSDVGLAGAGQRLVQAAQTDPDCRKFPRFKRLDDYTCILASLGGPT